MSQPEDSNGETSFEIIEKKTEELSVNSGKAELQRTGLPFNIPLASVPVSNLPVSSGNLLSNVKPPSALPNFITAPSPAQNALNTSPATTVTKPPVPQVATLPYTTNVVQEPYVSTQFSAAIPPSKGVISERPEPQKQEQEGGGIFDWMKGAVSTGGLLSKVAEKAKNSVDSMITTLDPQMREFIYSGGDVDVLVASSQQDKVSAIREAFQQVFGKATVGNMPTQPSNAAAQPVGFEAGIKAAEERIANALKTQSYQEIPVVVVENFLIEVAENQWFDLGVLLLNDKKRNVSLQTFTQMTPVPAEVVALAREDTPSDYPQKSSGFAVTIGSLMARNLQVDRRDWHQALTGVSRREMILLAAKTLANLYKRNLR